MDILLDLIDLAGRLASVAGRRLAERIGSGRQEDRDGWIGNRASRVYHRPACPACRGIRRTNLTFFQSEAEARKAGYRRATDCPRRAG